MCGGVDAVALGAAAHQLLGQATREEAVRFISERARWRVLVVAVALLSVTVLVTSSAGAAGK